MRLGITRFLATRAEDETVLVYLSCHGIQDRKHLYFAAADTRLVSALRCHNGWATGVAFSADGAMLTSSDADGAVALHDVGSGTYVHVLRSEGGIVNAMALSPDGTLLAAAYENGTIAVWELATGGHEFWRLHSGFVNDVVFSPSQRLLASAGKDGTVRLWR
jgi:WD40 repeat protein